MVSFCLWALLATLLLVNL
uniref:Uncharacterized protein n=1 Tax=Arundo donax TaxID=35708 RepID=A0A0A9H2I3_ARUDO